MKVHRQKLGGVFAAFQEAVTVGWEWDFDDTNRGRVWEVLGDRFRI